MNQHNRTEPNRTACKSKTIAQARAEAEEAMQTLESLLP